MGSGEVLEGHGPLSPLSIKRPELGLFIDPEVSALGQAWWKEEDLQAPLLGDEAHRPLPPHGLCRALSA